MVRRSYDAPVAEVFRAWEHPDELNRWHMLGGDTCTSDILEHGFRAGGRRLFVFGPPGVPPYGEDYDRRVCYAMTISHANVRITTSMVTVEFIPRGDETDLVVTDQLVILDGGDTAEDRKRGWGETLNKLALFLRTKQKATPRRAVS